MSFKTNDSVELHISSGLTSIIYFIFHKTTHYGSR